MGTDAKAAVVTADVAVVAIEAAGEQEQVESKPTVVNTDFVAIQVAEGDKLRRLDAELWSKAARVLLAVAIVSPPDMPAVHAL